MSVAAARTSVLSPSALGLPGRFRSYRTGQAEAAIALWTSDKRISCLSAPPGSGKSLLHVSVAQLVDEGWRTLYLTATKNLQRQVHAEFDELLKMVMGASNYRCIALDKGGLLEGYGAIGSSCADGPCKAGVRCRLRDGGCLHYDAEARARESRIVLTNYAKWLSMARYSDPMSLGKFDLIVADEAHLIPELLTDFSAVDLNAEEVSKLLVERLPALDEGVDTWASWARKTANVARMKVTALRAELKDVPRSMRQPLTKQLLRLSALERDLTEMGGARSWLRTDDASKQVDVPGGVTDWIAYETPKGAKFTPVWAHQYAERYLFRGVGKVVLSSGTLMPSIVKRLGISEQTYDWHEVPSSFDPKRRPVIYVPTTRVDNRMTEGQKRLWMNRIDDIISKRLDKKILIHSVSYARAQEIKARSKWAQHMIVHDSRTTQDAVAQFRKAKAPCVLVSPALVEGVDFPDDDVRVQIVCKVPFASATDPLFKARCKADPNYRFECAALLIVQMSGRGMRSSSDACETICVDDHYSYLRNKVSWPSWVRAAWKQMDRVPEQWTAAA